MNPEILLTIKIYLYVWIFIEFEPFQFMLNYLFEKIIPNKITEIIWVVLGCMKCLTLWTTLLITQNLLLALASSLVAQIHQKIIKD